MEREALAAFRSFFSISLSLFSVIPRLFKIDRFSWNVRPWRRFVAFFDQCSWNVRPWRRFVAFFSIDFNGTWGPGGNFTNAFVFLQRMHLVKGDLYYHQNSRMHFLKENKRIGEIPLSISLSLFSVIPRLFKIDRFSWNVRPWRRFVAFFDHMNVRPWRRFVAFFRSMFMEREALAGISPMRLFSFRECILSRVICIIIKILECIFWRKTNALAKFHYRSLYHSFQWSQDFSKSIDFHGTWGPGGVS